MSNILLIEPDVILAQTYQAALTDAGHHVDVSCDAQQAVIHSDKLRPDLVVLELQMPGHNGIEFLHEFRSYTEWQEIPVIAHTIISPSRLEQSFMPFRELGILSVLYKPTTTLKHLINTVENVMSTHALSPSS